MNNMTSAADTGEIQRLLQGLGFHQYFSVPRKRHQRPLLGSSPEGRFNNNYSSDWTSSPNLECDLKTKKRFGIQSDDVVTEDIQENIDNLIQEPLVIADPCTNNVDDLEKCVFRIAAILNDFKKTVAGIFSKFDSKYKLDKFLIETGTMVAPQEIVLDSDLRNRENYSNDIDKKDLRLTGINFESILNELPYLHVTDIHVFDIMHDIFEGVGPDIIMLTLNHLIVESFDYGRFYRTTKPSPIKASFLKGDTKIGQNASQTLCLIMNLPLILYDLVPDDDKIWNVFLLFKEVVDVIMADSITFGGVIVLKTYQEIFQKTLKPKHHHLTHYANSILEIGPLRNYWSMTFEAKHKFFKTSAHASCNFKNIAKTLAYRHQLSACFKLQSKTTYTPFR
ncbi:hypothetical protein Ocin01_19695 [Orchesella cincta]|uniref:Uncharacterized protein n=1 Tax=Orchesella cincta TaxID=48709 RepID=A0A1D2M201_ORCCI|nr:hypothetical protein Ocin01_19695 [Orchesella cincta]